MISLQHITLRREENLILDDVSLDIKEGENWVILGRNGSGKTTLLEMMTGYLFPSSGTVKVLGHTYGQVDLREVRKEIGYIGPSLMEKLTLRDPVWEVVATGAYAYLRFYQQIPGEIKAKAIALLEDMNMGRLANHTFGTLSQGERKKAMLARCLMADPKLLIMDEPCAGLDLYEREKMLAEVDKLNRREVTVVYVTHHVEEIVPLFTHVALIREGRLAGAGPKKEVLTGELMHAAYELPVEIEWEEERPWIKIKRGGEISA
ncbi:ABC transporter ATP-binding protein [Paenibacillus zanthoxyli]|uniref:ABC transporter ATP-binding protein n=1 Tax=Paenibacillus zanthoxyli TaxID=369399 RepID=UPI00046E8B9C|nr:ATP-binding cassette domain-containing protein [Paenibacillus zanthoxyli]